MKNKILYGIIGLVAIISIIYSFSGGQTEEEYIQEIEELRKEADRFMRNSEESPFNDSNIKYEGLKYFPPDRAYEIKARFTPIEEPVIYTLPTNDGKARQYLTYGHAEFKIDGKQQKLLILENVEENKLFLPFGDATSADETYGGGRYMDVTHTGGNTIELDFNKAYNPYCVYNANYTCPLPPKENLMEVAIKAGEKNY